MHKNNGKLRKIGVEMTESNKIKIDGEFLRKKLECGGDKVLIKKWRTVNSG